MGENELEEKKEMMSKDEAEGTLKLWAEQLELDTERELFTDMVDVLSMVVRKERLKFDEESEVFTYQLLKPMKEKNFVTIRETTFKEKKALQKFKDGEDMDAAGMMMAKHTNLSPVEVLELKTRDQKRINAVIMGFLSQ